ncbi:hypothetical protein HUN08_00240 [Gordonia sp. X0973]|uniref:hypothetical protein n=1 Tax=Gordonia sp. X0973 TaxID=2742602 RepID=UPI000F529C94|nr:hypothetical protein [Gordonia sp. X0973]QKT05801.1 hypothetical protein HUN08_00240 [Gordonia sp. X0973]
METWQGIDDFFASMNYWIDLQEALVVDRAVDNDPREFGKPYLDGNRVNIPSRLGPDKIEIYANYSIVYEGSRFAIKASGRGDRGKSYVDQVSGWYGCFEDAAKSFITFPVAGGTRQLLLNRTPPITSRWWSTPGLAPSWEARDGIFPGTEVAATEFYRTDQPSLHYYFDQGDDRTTTWLLNLSWDELLTLYTEDIPTAKRIPRPHFSDGDS